MTEYFTVTRELSAPRELVFEALTKPEHFAVWCGTAAVEVPQESLTMDVRPGGAFRAVMLLPDGNRIDWAGEYHVVEPPSLGDRCTVTSWFWAPDGASSVVCGAVLSIRTPVDIAEHTPLAALSTTTTRKS